MIEQIGTLGCETISQANPNATSVLGALLAEGIKAPVVAEIGIGIGATTLALAAHMNNAGELHLFDFDPKVQEVRADLAELGFTNIRCFGNTDKHWDSYNWTLGQMLLSGRSAVYDYIYIDGAHTFAVDALAFVLCDRLLKPGGYLEFDDYNWSFSQSQWMRETRDSFMTAEQIATPQVKMVVDLFLRSHPGYVALQKNRLFRKAAAAPGSAPALGAPGPETETVNWHGQSFNVIQHAGVATALTEFRSPFEEGTLQFFDAALAYCDKMVDVGAHVGLMSLYAAGRVPEVFAYEASPTNFNLLARNIEANLSLQYHIKLFEYGLSDRDQLVPIYHKAIADSGASIFRSVERNGVVNGEIEATVAMRNADVVLRDIGVDGGTLLKIDIEGAEYLVVPAIAALLAEKKPFLHLSFHPFNLVVGDDEYATALRRLRCSLQLAEALAPYRFMYFYVDGAWHRIDASERMIFLRHYLLRAKPASHIAKPQYGFIDAIGFSDVALPALVDDGAPRPSTPARE